MIQTAENVATKHAVDRASQDELTLHRYAQYRDALADDGTASTPTESDPKA